MRKKGYPHSPGHRGIDTSIAAADSIADAVPAIRKRVHHVVAERAFSGCIADEIAEACGLSVHQVRARLSELRRDGKIADSGRRGIGASGRRAIVWVTAEHRQQEAA